MSKAVFDVWSGFLYRRYDGDCYIERNCTGVCGFAVGARAGTAISAEIANMQVTSQVDAIKTLKFDPVGIILRQG